MGKFSKLNLKWYEEDDLEALEEEYHISEKSIEELKALASDLYWEAQGLYAKAIDLGNQADAISEYIRLIET